MADPRFRASPVSGMRGFQRDPSNPLHDSEDVPSNEWIPTHSTYMRRFRYVPLTSALDVEFPDGTVARYFEVPWSVFWGLVSAPSRGKYAWAHIRNSFQFDYQ